MSFSTKVVTTYAKSLFQNINNPQLSKRKDESFKLSKITSPDQKESTPYFVSNRQNSKYCW